MKALIRVVALILATAGVSAAMAAGAVAAQPQLTWTHWNDGNGPDWEAHRPSGSTARHRPNAR